MVVRMRHQLVRFFGRGIQAQGMIHVVMNRKGCGGIGTIDAGGTGIN